MSETLDMTEYSRETILAINDNLQEAYNKAQEKITRLEAYLQIADKKDWKNKVDIYNRIRPICGECGSYEVNVTWQDRPLSYGVKNKLTLLVRQPVLLCTKCEYPTEFTNWEGEDIREAACKPLMDAGIK